MPYVSDVWELWRVGFFDGEGHIGIYRRIRPGHGQENYYLRMGVDNTRVQAIDKFHQCYPGTRGFDDSQWRRKGNNKPLHRWQITGHRAALLLEKWRPYLLAHGDRVELALKFDEFKQNHHSYRHTEDEIGQMRLFFQEMHRLNKRGR